MKKMNTKTKITIIVLSVLVALTTAVVTFGADNDPLVTLSYINETVIPKITEEVKNAVLEILDARSPETPADPDVVVDPDIIVDPTPVDPTPVEPEAPAVTEDQLASLKYSVVYLRKGEKLLASGANTEATEIILRAGEVVAVSPFDNQGIADLTASKELCNNDPLVKNNYCLIPRGGDGRGIYAANGDAYIMVRGEYEIVQE